MRTKERQINLIYCKGCLTSFTNIFDKFIIKRNKCCADCLEKKSSAIAEREINLMLVLDENNALFIK